MFKKIFLLAFSLVLMPMLVSGQEEDFKTINGLKYYKTMFSAVSPETWLRLSMGKAENSVAGVDDDEEIATEGVPWAFRASNSQKIWILDTLNGAIKLFDKNGSVEKNIDISVYGKRINDMAVAADEKLFALLDSTEGILTLIKDNSEKVFSAKGFVAARAIEFSPDGSVLVNSPMDGGVIVVDSKGQRTGKLDGDQSLSLFQNAEKKLMGIEISGKSARLFCKNQEGKKYLADFDYNDAPAGVTYAGAEILGFDKAGNVYLELIACDSIGYIYRERLVRCKTDGKDASHIDVFTMPYMAPELPRRRIVSPEGKIIGFYVDETDGKYVLVAYSIP